MTSKYWIVEATLGRSYTTFKNPHTKESEAIDISSDRIGPFKSISEIADYLSKYAINHASYQIIRETEPRKEPQVWMDQADEALWLMGSNNVE